MRKTAHRWDTTPLKRSDDGEEMYFVHSFYAKPTNKENVLADTEYGEERFCSAVVKDNVYGCQFHPEKSSWGGLKILESFVNLKN